jgi:outer membrane biosynthesis protein TonB
MVRRSPDSKETGVAQENHDPGSRRVCIVSSKPILSAELVAAIKTALRPHEEIEIIHDRRRDQPIATESEATHRPSIERRRHAHVDRLVKTEGFAIVPVRSANLEPRNQGFSPSREAPAESGFHDDADDQDRRELERIMEFKRRQAGRGERSSRADVDEDRSELDHILDLQRRQEVRVGSWLVLTALLAAGLILVVQLPAVKTLLSSARHAAPPAQSHQEATTPAPTPPAPPAAENPPVAEKPPVAESPRVAEKPAIAEKAAPVEEPRLRQPELPAPRARVPDRPEAVRPRENSAVTRATLPSSASPPTVGASRSPSMSRSMTTQSPFPGLPRVEVVRDAASTAEGRGAAYAVRISDVSGRPMSGAEVMLLARMADGSVENIPLGSGAEPGSYHGALPPGQSAPVDLRVRVITTDKRIEIPLKP